MYCVMNFNVFVCSACAGIHREMTHKVKGISMSVFTEQELKDLEKDGNAVSELVIVIDMLLTNLDCPCPLSP